MGLTSGATLAVLILLALAAPVVAAAAWNRTGRSAWLRWPARVGLLLACQLTGCAALAAAVNDAGQFFTSWSELFGTDVGVSAQAGRAGAADALLQGQLAAGYRTHHSIVVTVPIPDAGDGRAHDALVYLPAAYFDPGYAHRAFPVVELLDGFPGSPLTWTRTLGVQHVADGEIAAGRALPFVAVLPQQNYLGRHDAECIDAVHGPQVQTTLTTNVRAVVDRELRVGDGPASWAVMGYSTGGFCALDIVLRQPDRYAAAVSLSGYDQPYLDRTTGNLFGTSALARHLNDPLWRVEHLPPPKVSLLLAEGGQDRVPATEAVQFAAATRSPTSVYLLRLPRGGHSFAVCRALEPVAFDWISQRLTAPLAPMVLTGGLLPTPPVPAHHAKPPAHRTLARAARRATPPPTG